MNELLITDGCVKNGKPHPEMLRRLMARFEVEPGETIAAAGQSDEETEAGEDTLGPGVVDWESLYGRFSENVDLIVRISELEREDKSLDERSKSLKIESVQEAEQRTLSTVTAADVRATSASACSRSSVTWARATAAWARSTASS